MFSVEPERDIEKGLREKFMDKLRAEAERKVLKQMSVILADAHRQAADIIKAAQCEAMDRAKMPEKAKATREARKAQAVASQAGALKVEVLTQPTGQQAIEVPPWDEPSTEAQEGPQMA